MSRSAKPQKEDLSLESSIPTSSVPLDAILCTEELARRPSRPPDYENENRALVALASALAESPQTILQKLAETILEITQSDSSGVSLLTTDGTRFYWPALAGRWTPHIGEGTPRDFGPCGDVLDRNMPLLMRHWERRYTYFGPISPPVEEGLLVPFYLGGKAVGTIWVVMHDDHRKFDAEDERVLTGLSKFASTAYQALASIEDLKLQVAARERAEAALLKLTEGLEAQVRVRTQQLELQVQVLQNMPVNAWTVLPDGMQDFTNQQWLEYTGLTMDRFLSSPQAWMNALHPDDHERAAAAFWGGIRSGSAFTSETRFRRVSDGEYRWHLNRGIPLRDSAGNLIKFVGTSTDIEDVKRAEEALRASERDFRLIVDTIPGMVCTLKADWEVEFVNKPLREYFGKTLEELKDWEFIGVVHPDDIERVVAKTRHSSATGEPYDVEHRCLRHDGVFRWFQVRAMPLRDVAGHLVRWYLLLTDIEDRKRAEEALQARERNLSLIINTMPVLAWSARPDGSAEFLSQRWLEYTGFSAEQAKDWGWTAALHRDDAEGLLKISKSSLVSGAPLEAEARMRRFDGAYRWLLFRASALRDESGNIVKWYGTAVDIEDRKQAEQQLRRNEWNLLEAQRLGRSGSWSLDVSSGIVTTTPEILRTFDVRPGEDTSKPDFWFGRIHHEDRKWVRELFEKCLAEKTDYDAVYRVLRPDGSISHQHSIGRPIVNDSGDVVEFMGAAIDITEQVEARDALLKAFAAIEKSEDQLRAIINTIPALVWSASPDGSPEFFNQRWLDYTGLAAERAAGLGWTVIHPDDRDRMSNQWRNAITTGEPVQTEGRQRRFDGEYRWFLFRANPLRDELGNIVKWYGINTDIDDRKRAEEQLRRSEESLRLQVEVLQYMPAAAWTLLPDGATDFANQQWLEYTGQTLEYKRSSPGAWMTALHPDDLERGAAAFWEGIRSGKATTVETRFRRSSDGEYRWHLNRAIPLRDSSGKLIKFVGTSTDIEDLKRAERELRQLIDFLPQHVVVLDKDGALLNANKTMLDYVGLTLEEMKGGGTRERINRDIHPDERERVQKERSAGLAKGVPFESEKRMLGKDGQFRWFLFRYNPLLNEAGDIVRWFVAATDIEDRKQAEDRMRNETVALREQIDRESMFEDIVGSSESLHKVLRQVAGVARTDSTVLICGETGTGKELIARAIHKRSLRSDQAFVSVNCASIPPSLIASELFGHEKGAFTGALQQRKGRFELAHGGTIFLDEIGELPAETQIALLRVLQERQFERVGGSKTISADVRVIAATNRDLSAAIAAGTFRADLFYRLNVFPIQVPPLRLRRDDIPMLVEYFVKRFAEKMGKQINRIDKGTIELCQKYPWPGNIRELQNIVERSVILCGGNTFSIDEAWLSVNTSPGVSVTRPMGETLQDHEREIIEAALAESKGRVAGPNGAAVKLGIPRSTLDRKIQQLKIKKREFLPE